MVSFDGPRTARVRREGVKGLTGMLRSLFDAHDESDRVSLSNSGPSVMTTPTYHFVPSGNIGAASGRSEDVSVRWADSRASKTEQGEEKRREGTHVGTDPGERPFGLGARPR